MGWMARCGWFQWNLFIHNEKSRKHGKIKLYTELYTLSTGNYVNLDKNEAKNQEQRFCE